MKRTVTVWLCFFAGSHTLAIFDHKGTLPDGVRAVLAAQVPFLQKNDMQAEIAFFGGSFTAVDGDYRRSLLYAASEYVREFPEIYYGIRCSTRPDCIDEEILDELKLYGMTAVELGAQSMNDEVLKANLRGHTAEDVRRASRLIKAYGFQLGLQMMTGLYKDTVQSCIDTAREFAALGADTVRIYPTVILRGTMLDELRENGVYDSFSFEETVELCADLLEFFEKENIPVIRLGLHASEGVENAMTGGVYHPALGEIVKGRIMLRRILEQAEKLGGKRFVIYTDKRNMSLVAGHKGVNRKVLEDKGIRFKIKVRDGADIEVENLPFTQLL